MDASQVLSILKPGCLIKTQLGSLTSWNINTVIQVNKDNIIVPFIEDYLASTLLVNDVLKCRFMFGEHEFTLTCLVEDIQLSFPPTMQLKVLKVDVWKNIRDSERYDVNYLGKIVGIDEQYEALSIITNLSDTGAAVICKEQLSNNSNIKLNFSVREAIHFSTFANVVRNKKTLDYKIEYGLRFYNLTEEEKQQISMVIKQEKLLEEGKFTKFCAGFGITPASK